MSEHKAQNTEMYSMLLLNQEVTLSFCIDLVFWAADELRHEVREVLQQCYAAWRKQMDDHKQDMLVMPVQVSQPHASSNAQMNVATARVS